MGTTSPCLQPGLCTTRDNRSPTSNDLWYRLGKIQAQLMQDYPADKISIKAGVFVAETLEGRLLYRYTNSREHLTNNILPVALPCNYPEPPEYADFLGAHAIPSSFNYHPFMEVSIILSQLGAAPFHHGNQDRINHITTGTFIGKNHFFFFLVKSRVGGQYVSSSMLGKNVHVHT